MIRLVLSTILSLYIDVAGGTSTIRVSGEVHVIPPQTTATITVEQGTISLYENEAVIQGKEITITVPEGSRLAIEP